MICQKCGNEVNEGVKFCTKCGTKFSDGLIINGLIINKDYFLPILSAALSFIGILGRLLLYIPYYKNISKMSSESRILNVNARYIFSLLIYAGIILPLIMQYQKRKKDILLLYAGLIPCAYFVIPILLRLLNFLVKFPLPSWLIYFY